MPPAALKRDSPGAPRAPPPLPRPRGGAEGGRTHLLLALVMWPLAAHPLRDGAPFLVLSIDASNVWVLITSFPGVLRSIFCFNLTLLVSPFNGHHLSPAGGGAFVACLSHSTIDHAALSRRSTVPTPTRHQHLGARYVFSVCYVETFAYLIPFVFRRLWPPSTWYLLG